jgi:hypothetical protein
MLNLAEIRRRRRNCAMSVESFSPDAAPRCTPQESVNI